MGTLIRVVVVVVCKIDRPTEQKAFVLPLMKIEIRKSESHLPMMRLLVPRSFNLPGGDKYETNKQRVGRMKELQADEDLDM